MANTSLQFRQWEPDFKASTATLSSVAIWIRLPELPIEYYDHDMLLKIGKLVRLVPRIDSNTAKGARGRFARLCVQVNLDKLLIKRVHIGKNVQSIQYEGINSLCFLCGRVGHKKEACPFIIRENLKEKAGVQDAGVEPNTATQDSQEQRKVKTDEYGDWMVVNQRKMPNKHKGRMPVEVVNQSVASHQS